VNNIGNSLFIVITQVLYVYIDLGEKLLASGASFHCHDIYTQEKYLAFKTGNDILGPFQLQPINCTPVYTAWYMLY